MSKVCVVYTHHKLGDLIWQLPYIKSISNHHKKKVEIIVRSKTQAKKLLIDLKYIKEIHYNEFRKGLFYWIDVWYLIDIFNKKKYSFVYLLDKVNKPALAAKIAGIRNIIGPGINNQKKWLTNNNFLTEDDRKLSYSEQSQKLLKINSIKINNYFPKIKFNRERYINFEKINNIKSNRVSFGVDSFEDYKIWYEKNFIILADLLHKKKLFDYVYLICSRERADIAKKIIDLSQKKYFIDCSQYNIQEISFIIGNSNFFVGNNSGPLNLAAALNVKSYGLIVNDPVSELKYSKIKPIHPKNYVDNKWIRSRKNMNSLNPKTVYEYILKDLKNES